jgi:hypothetical protein
MIITSNSISHNYTVPNLSIIGEVNGLSKVAYKATVYLTSSIIFPYTYETTIYNVDSPTGITTTVTEDKTVSHFTYYDVELNTININPIGFIAWEDLTEEQVLGWIFEKEEALVQEIQTKNEEIVLEEQDKVLNPLKYYRDSPPTPWRIRADQESSII